MRMEENLPRSPKRKRKRRRPPRHELSLKPVMTRTLMLLQPQKVARVAKARVNHQRVFPSTKFATTTTMVAANGERTVSSIMFS